MQPQPGSSRFGKYDLLAHLATGGMAEIYLAKIIGESGFEKLVVVKRLLEKLAVDPEYVEMFLDEARINARLSHTNVVQVLELGKVDGHYFMAMEYVSGLSVAQVGKLATQRLGSVPQEIASGIVSQACAGLNYAHEKKLPDGTNLGIIHRDISPQNLILTIEGIVKVVDFGIAKAEGRATQTRAGIIKGKFAYMAPEQCVGDPIDRRADVFALGIVLFELCTSRRLFKRENTYRTYEAITNCDVPDPRSVNPAIAPEVCAVITKALAKHASERYQTAEEMQEALERAMAKAHLRGAPMHLAAFLERVFAEEIAAQRALIAKAESGQLVGKKPGGVDKVAGALTEGDPDEPTSVYQHDMAEVTAEPTSIDTIPTKPEEEIDIAGVNINSAPSLPAISVPATAPAAPVPPVAGSQGTGAAAPATPQVNAPPPEIPLPLPLSAGAQGTSSAGAQGTSAPVPVPPTAAAVTLKPKGPPPDAGEGFPWFTFAATAIAVATIATAIAIYILKQ